MTLLLTAAIVFMVMVVAISLLKRLVVWAMWAALLLALLLGAWIQLRDYAPAELREKVSQTATALGEAGAAQAERLGAEAGKAVGGAAAKVAKQAQRKGKDFGKRVADEVERSFAKEYERTEDTDGSSADER